MMIQVEHLSKRYTGFTAINDLNFEVEKGEIVGFLGPNGAGKSTTMRILSGFMPATSGTARIAGFDIFSESMEARRRLGYMPENVPLYTDMRVDEYLRYRAALKEITGSKQKEKVGDVKELCHLRDVENRIIGTLSKGYRQRVGLADALLHSPDLLILDEPTIGLDPNQIRQVRDLIRTLGKHHTILLSTHILPEVEMTCSRVVIINKGRIEAADTPENLVRSLRATGGIFLEANPGQDNGVELLGALPGVKEVKERRLDRPAVKIETANADETEPPAPLENKGWSRFTLKLDPKAADQGDPREAVWQLAAERRWAVRELTRRRATLEDVFVEMTALDNED